MKRYYGFSCLLLVFIAVILSSCGNGKSNNISSEPVITEESNKNTSELEVVTPTETIDREIKISYFKSTEKSDKKEIQDTIDKINQFQYDLTIALLEEMDIKYSFETFPTDEDVYTSVSRNDSDVAFGYPRNNKVEEKFDYSYSYLYAIINFSSFDYKEHFSFLVKKENNEILDIFNEGIKRLKENGKYTEVYQTHFADDDSMSIMNN
ncbi:ABC-type amino acid transport substrate-binding protein [Paenibacillus sp. DS2015]|uniref:transporter substrate-binding domain-containing protein n=1 Tax=Paenibacillus sp. DS2015 TaxID=3373917 RepID=UPI003D1C5A43